MNLRVAFGPDVRCLDDGQRLVLISRSTAGERGVFSRPAGAGTSLAVASLVSTLSGHSVPITQLSRRKVRAAATKSSLHHPTFPGAFAVWSYRPLFTAAVSG